MKYSADERYLLKDPCVYCGGESTALDHIVPRSAGGVNWWPNRAPACIRCDNAKGNEALLFFMIRMRREPLASMTPKQRRRHERTRRAFAIFDKPGCYPVVTRLQNGELNPDTIWGGRIGIETRLQGR